MASDAKPSTDGATEARRAEFLHRSVTEVLRQRLLDGRLRGGTKLPALRELASELAVSTMTVQRALRTLESEGHVYRIGGVGAFVRPSAAGLRRIAFVGSDLTSPFQMALALGAQRAAQASDWSIHLLDAHWDVNLELANIRRLPELGVQGALLLPPFSDPGTPGALVALQKDQFPMVVLDSVAPALKTDLVSSDHEAGAYQATRHLLEHGHRQVLLLSHPPITSSLAARVAGYDRALASAGIRPPPEWKVWIDNRVHEDGYREGRPWWGACQAIQVMLGQVERPLAVLAVDAYIGWGVYEACRELNLRIPKDVSVVAFDDIEVSRVISPPMTIVSQRTDEIARVAIELLCSRIQAARTGGTRAPAPTGHKEMRQVLIDVGLIERGSVAGFTEP